MALPNTSLSMAGANNNLNKDSNPCLSNGVEDDSNLHSNEPANSSTVKKTPKLCNGQATNHSLLKSEHIGLVAELRALVRPLQAAEEAERLSQIHRSKIKRLRAVSRHLEGELAKRKQIKCDKQLQTDPILTTGSNTAGLYVGGVSVNPFTKAFANRANSFAGVGSATVGSSSFRTPLSAGVSAATAAAAASGFRQSGASSSVIDLTAASSVSASLTTSTLPASASTSAFSMAPPPPPAGPPLEVLATLPLPLKQAPLLQVCANTADKQSAELHWTLRNPVSDPRHQISSYSVWYCYHRPGRSAESWAKTADLRALPLPMRCQVGIDNRRGACHFVLRAEDGKGRAGLWSNVVTWPPIGPDQQQQQQQQQRRSLNAI